MRWVPPRGDVPGRPDPPALPGGPAGARRWWLAPVAIVAVLALFAGIGISLGRGSPGTDGRGPAAARSSPDPGYAFLDSHLMSGQMVPVRWNPCEPILYQVNLAGAPSDALEEIQRATSRVTEATGIPFTFDGTTDRTLRRTSRDLFFSHGIEQGSYYPVLFAWIAHDQMVHITDEKDVLAFAHPEEGRSEASDQWVSGAVVVDTGGRFEQSGRYSLEMVLMHELGHLVGLEHVTDPDELMFSQEVAAHTAPVQMYDWGPGDLIGLELVGHDQGCMDHVDVAP